MSLKTRLRDLKRGTRHHPPFYQILIRIGLHAGDRGNGGLASNE